MNAQVNHQMAKARGLAAAMLVALLLLVCVLGSAAAPLAADWSRLVVRLQTTPDRGLDFQFVHNLLIYVDDTLLGSGGTGGGQFRVPKGIAYGGYNEDVGGYETYFIVDNGNDRVQLWYEEDYSGLLPGGSFGGSGAGSGKFIDPVDVAVDAAGDVYVTDRAKPLVQKFTWDGDYLGAFGSQGTGPGQFQSPTAIAISEQGYIYVGDRANHNVQVFDGEGAFLHQLGHPGRGPGYFVDPSAIFVNPLGDVFVADSMAHNIQKFDATGAFVTMWGEYGSGPGQLRHPSGIATDDKGLLYVSDANGHVQVFDQQGNALGAMMPMTGAAVKAEYYDLIYSDWLGLFYITDLTHNGVRQIWNDYHPITPLDDGQGVAYDVYTEQGEVTETLHVLNAPFGWAVDEVTCDGSSPTQTNFGAKLVVRPGTEVSCTVGLIGPAAALTVGVLDSAVPTQTHTFTVDPGGLWWNRESFPAGMGEWETQGLAIDAAGQIHIIDNDRKAVRVYNATGTFLRQWGGPGSGDGQFIGPSSIGVSPDGKFYVTDYSLDRVQMFASDGAFIRLIGGRGTAESQFEDPQGVGFDPLGNAYIADSDNHRVQVFDESGDFVRMWGWGVRDGSEELQVCTSDCRRGLWGEADNQFSYPRYVAADGLGHVFVSNNGRDDIQVYTTGGAFVRILPQTTDVSWQAPLATDSFNNLYVLGYQLLKFDRTGRLLSRAAYHNDVTVEMGNMRGLSVGPDGTVYGVLVPWTNGPKSLQVFRQDGPALQHGQTQAYGLAPGRYVIDALKLGEAWPAISCRGGTVETARGRAIVTLAEGDDATCTFNYGVAPRAYLPTVRR